MQKNNIIIVVALLVLGVAFSLTLGKKYLGDDNAIEEFTETGIEDATGVDIDLTPLSIEKN